MARDREILVALYNALDGPNWEDGENWLSDAPLGEWAGVDTDDNGRVYMLWLGPQNSGQALNGEIPPELGDLGALEYLILDGWEASRQDGRLSGEIPPELGNIPDLIELILTGNQLSGEIPSELANLNPNVLNLSDNQLSGEIPPELANYENPTGLFLNDNRLTGEIPSELGNLDSLASLNLGRNQLSGGIPPELGNLANLEDLVLGNNLLSGKIPSELGKLLGQGATIEIHGNQFECIAIARSLRGFLYVGDVPDC